MEGISSEKQEFRIRDSGRWILGAGGSDKKTGPLSVESPRIKDLIKIANASINKFFFWSHSQGYIFFLSQGLGCTNVGIPFLLCKYLFVYFWNNRILLSELLEKVGMSTVIVVTWWGVTGYEHEFCNGYIFVITLYRLIGFLQARYWLSFFCKEPRLPVWMLFCCSEIGNK